MSKELKTKAQGRLSWRATLPQISMLLKLEYWEPYLSVAKEKSPFFCRTLLLFDLIDAFTKWVMTLHKPAFCFSLLFCLLLCFCFCCYYVVFRSKKERKKEDAIALAVSGII